jgi:hypothetical protein
LYTDHGVEPEYSDVHSYYYTEAGGDGTSKVVKATHMVS